jgi:hypothetical protein
MSPGAVAIARALQTQAVDGAIVGFRAPDSPREIARHGRCRLTPPEARVHAVVDTSRTWTKARVQKGVRRARPWVPWTLSVNSGRASHRPTPSTVTAQIAAGPRNCA